MIFAHGPLGAVSSLLVRKHVRFRWALIVGFIGGIFPDIDLFYYYLVNAERSHRELITHTPFVYVVIGVVGYLVFRLLQKRSLAGYTLVFSIGALTHTFTDAIASQLRLLFPFSNELFGLSDLNHWFINSNLFFLNFLVEGMCFAAFFYLLIVVYSRSMQQRLLLSIGLLVVFGGGLLTLMNWNAHVYHGDNNYVWNDNDGDGISNVYDLDIDGDGTANIDDLDADGDGAGNVEEVAINSEDFFEVWYDPTDGGVLQIPLRMGLLTNEDFPRRLYATAGIFIGTEMKNDYDRNPEGYVSTPSNSDFDHNPENLRTWFTHMNRLEEDATLKEGRNQIGDVLFFENGSVNVITGFDQFGNAQVLDVHKERGIQERPLEALVEDEGIIVARGKMLNATAVFK